MKNIPKIFYAYWNGARLSFLHYLTILSFHKYNPEWKIIVYISTRKYDNINTSINPQYLTYKGRDFLPELKKLDYIEIFNIDYSHKYAHSIPFSDIWRREILYENGGVYSDIDTLWLRPMSEFVNIDCIGNASDFEAMVCMYELTHGFHNVSELISEKESPFMDYLIRCAKNIPPPYSDQSFGTELLNREFPTLESVVNKYPRILAVPYVTFYPYSTFDLGRLFIRHDLTPLENKNVMAIHWFNGNKISYNYIHGNYKTDCSMTTILKKEGWI